MNTREILNIMRTEQLEQLIAIIRRSSFSLAAADLHMAQSTLSISMKNLEKELGITIFRRQGRTVVLTPEGEEVYRRAMVIRQELDSLSHISHEVQKNRYALSVSNSFSLLGGDTITDIYTEHKENILSLKIEDCAINRIIANVSSGKSELGILRFPQYKYELLSRLLEANNLEYIKKCTENACIVVGKNNPLYHIENDCIDIEHIRKYTFATHFSESVDMIWNGFLSDLGITDIRLSLASVGALMDALRTTDLAFIDTKKDNTRLSWYKDIRYIELRPAVVCELGFVKQKGSNLSVLGQMYMNHFDDRVTAWKG